MRSFFAAVVAFFVAFAVVGTAFAGQAQWMENRGWFKSMAMYGPSSPVSFTGKEARAAACRAAPFFSFMGKQVACDKAEAIKIAASGCRGKAMGKRDPRLLNMVICVREKFPVVVGGVTFIDASGQVLLK